MTRRPLLRHMPPCALGLAAVAAVAAPASADVAAPHLVSVAYNNGPTVLLGEYAAGTPLTVTVTRPGLAGQDVEIATAAVTPNAEGAIINSPEAIDPADAAAPATACWDGAPPEILPGDTVAVTGGTADDDMVVEDVSITQAPRQVAPGVVEMRGVSKVTEADFAAHLSSATNRFDANNPQARNGGQTLVPDTLTLDGERWTARFENLSDADLDVALNSATAQALAEVATEGATPEAHGTAETVFELPAFLGGFAEGDCAGPAARWAVTGANPSTVNQTTVSSGNLVISGMASNDVTTVQVRVDDTDPSTPPLTAQVAGFGASDGASKPWTATFTGAQAGTLGDGTLTASAQFVRPDGTMPGRSLDLSKDTVAPGAVSASEPSGTYTSARSVTLSSTGADVIRYTTDGSDPRTSGTAQTYSGPITVSSSQTLRAVAEDAAGNRTAVADFTYTIQPPQQQQQPSTATQPAPPRSGVQPSAASPVAVTARLLRVSVARSLRRSTVRSKGILVRLQSEDAARILVQLRRGGRTVYSRSRAARQRLRLNTSAIRRMRTGRYQLTLVPVSASGERGQPVTRRLAVRR